MIVFNERLLGSFPTFEIATYLLIWVSKDLNLFRAMGPLFNLNLWIPINI